MARDKMDNKMFNVAGRLAAGNQWCDKYYEALCVFHNEETPSLQINIIDGTWICLSCGRRGELSEGGDIS